ncbi:TPA: sulfate adenylyltransferase subunit CysN [Candidatus Thalassarchaeaceae archaeon]|jgi:bifunctional enzyme CysN/CysC|nr:sulfate adenylyltransferase subunit CysN [Euryarchaeota archaeon]DAC64871.1 MAG TPA: sulfate adenylyltransferase subunit CysN [Candidatus Poseidoniales archaeon]HIH05756.1 sulfate adenylyltransferase subunit CysN [Candidatus Thalassarchaeaceae archaeon]MDC3326137.1 sulfate adenylyltransferase subunit CysN [Euryarchaeota archaeon]DAC65692.1 MAG TPA: sulfate adenylyltransferase subunit CysN [Candidatus Poseidoniales archaeon]
MSHISSLIATDIDSYLKSHEEKSLLRFITCGSVDDGKSTLIGRMLYESHMLFDDQLSSLKIDSKKVGTQGEEIDFALLVDGLAAEREQGITIDVAYRFFSTDKRKYIVADTPGHEEYTRNMATGASTADVAIILVDAEQGVLTQTRRHSFIVSMVGVKNVLLAINKLDLVEYSQQVYDDIVSEYREFADSALNLESITPIPISALMGDNVVNKSENTPWFNGQTIMQYLETVEVSNQKALQSFRMPVQWVNRPNSKFRGFSGLISSGEINTGDEVRILPGGNTSRIKSIITWEGELPKAKAGKSVTITLEDEIDVSRGDIIAPSTDPCGEADQFQTRILWMNNDAMMPGRQYLLKSSTQSATLTLGKLKHRIDVNTLDLLPAKTLQLNEIGVCNISLDKRIAFDSYDENQTMGGFIIVDRLSNNTVGMGLIDFALRRSENIHWQKMDVSQNSRAEQKSQTPRIIWFTGLSGSGKSSIANILEKKLQSLGKHTITLDGDNIRHGLNRDLGFTEADRVENIRRVGEVARLMLNSGLICITSFISPFESERAMARSLVSENEFVEVFVDTPLSVCEERDVKGLYAKARSGEIPNFTGISSPFEGPKNPEIRIDTTKISAEEAANQIIEFITKQ